MYLPIISYLDITRTNNLVNILCGQIVFYRCSVIVLLPLSFLFTYIYRSSQTAPLVRHWLPIEWRTKFKLASLTYKALHTGHPPYLAELLQYHKPVRSTRSSASDSLSVPRHNLLFGSRAFRISAPKVWNSLLPHIL